MKLNEFVSTLTLGRKALADSGTTLLIGMASLWTTLPAHGAASKCPDEVTIAHVIFKHLGQGRFMCGPSNPAYGGLSRCTDLEDTLSLEGSPRGLSEDERQRAVAWAKCHITARKGGAVSANSGAASTQAEHTGTPGRNKNGVVSCPVRVPRDCVQWAEKNPDLHFWNVNNTCDGPIIVIYEDSSVSNGRTLTDWIHPGNYQSIKTYSRPRFNTYDAKSVTQFHKSRYNKPGDFMTCVMSETLR